MIIRYLDPQGHWTGMLLSGLGMMFGGGGGSSTYAAGAGSYGAAMEIEPCPIRV